MVWMMSSEVTQEFLRFPTIGSPDDTSNPNDVIVCGSIMQSQAGLASKLASLWPIPLDPAAT